MTTIRGTAGDDNLTGTSGNDNILVFQGGDDTVQAGDGNDVIRLGAALTAADKIDGGTGRDAMILNGDYSAGVMFNADTMTNVEVLSLAGGHSYNLTLNDGNVAAGAGLLVKAGSLGSGESLTFDGSAETDGQFAVVGGAGDDTITGGAQGDHFRMEKGGVDTVNGGGGNDVFYMGDQLWSDDQIDGGSGHDTVLVNGFAGGDSITLTATTLQNIEDFVLDGGTFLSVTTDDGTVAAGATLTIDASAQTTAFVFDGSAETDGQFTVIGGKGDDTLTGGAGADTFHLELGGVDTANGGDGNDRFFMGASFTASDQIEGGAGLDTVYVNGNTAVAFTATTITDVERLVLGAGHSYNFIENDANVAAGQSLTIDASALGAGNRLQFHGDAETDGTFTFIGGAGDDQISGGSGGDRFHLENGGNDTAFGGGGNDHFYMGASLTAADRIVGGSGYDTVILNGGAPVTFSATTMNSVERIDLTAGHSYSLTINSATVGFNQLLTIDGSTLGAGDTLTFNGAAETTGSFDVIGGAGDDVITGGKWGDFIDLSFGGNDTVTLGRGFNQVFLGAALTSADHINGSAGHFDQVILNGDYTGAHAVVFDAATMVNIDDLVVGPGFSYDLTTNDGNLSANQGMEVDGFLLGAGDSLKFDGSAETNGFFILNDGAGNDVLKGGARGDFLSFDGGGTDVGSGGAGNDFIDACGHFDVTDQFDGGTGIDTIELTASDAGPTGYTGANALVLTATMMKNIELMELDNGGSYDITTVDANVAAHSSLTVDGSFLNSGDSFTFDGSAETNGSFHFYAGASLTTHLTGGGGNDTFDFSFTDSTADTQAFGNGGDDTFSFLANFDSSSQIIDGGTGNNTLSLDGEYSSISLVGSGIIDNIQTVTFAGGHSYAGIQVFDDVAGGGTLTLDTTGLLTGNVFELDASASTDAIHLLGGAGNYTVTGSAQNDTFDMGGDFSTLDAIDGGDGTDTVNLDGDYTGATALAFTATMMTNVENLVLAGGHSYDITTDDATVASSATLTVGGSGLGAGDTLTFDGSAETDGSFDFLVNAASYTLTGGLQDDTFEVGAGYTGADAIDGGGGTGNVVNFSGDYSAGSTLSGASIQNIQTLQLWDNGSYNFTSTDDLFAAGATVTIDGSDSSKIIFDASAESDAASIVFYDGAGNDVLTGGSVALNTFTMFGAGDDTVHTSDNLTTDNVIDFKNFFTAADTVDGGLSNDNVILEGDYTGANALVFTPTTMTGVETLTLNGGFSYDITTDDATVASGATLTVSAAGLGAGDSLTFDGSAETDGSFAITGGAGDDTVSLSAAAVFDGSTFNGGGGSDTLELTSGDDIVFSASTITNVETLKLDDGSGYGLTLNDGNVAAGATLTVDASALTGTNFLVFNGSAESDGSYDIIGGAGNDLLTGGAQNDGFNLTQGGNDTAHGGVGNDTFSFGAAFTAADTIDGGANSDTLSLNGDYSAGVVFTATTMTNVENIVVQAGHDYNLTTADATVASGATLNVTATALGAGDTLTFDGSAETNGNFRFFIDSAQVLANSQITGGAGSDTIVLNGDFSSAVAFSSATIQSIENITLTAGNSYSLDLSGDSVATGATIAIDGSTLGAGDHFYFGFDTTGGGDSSYTLTGGAGDDGFFMLDAFSASDKIDGGSGGNDEIQINGDYSAGVTFNADTVKNIGYFAVLNGNSYSLTENDGNVAAGATMAVTGSILGASNYLHFYGAAETDGHFDLIGGAGDDILEGGSMGDSLTGNGGADTFLYTGASQSSSTTYDTITDFAAGTDHFDLTTAITGVFAVSGSLDSGANFDSELAGLGVIQASGATVLTVTGGTLAGHTFLVVDGNGDDVYTAGQDYVFDITNYTGTITTGDFI